METVAGNYLRAGDLANAAQLYTSLEHLNPKYARMARLCRVLNDPVAVPLPHRHQDLCEALLEPVIPPQILIGEDLSTDTVQKKYQRLVVHVHPDKNPHPKAADAFLRLGELREKAVTLAEAKKAEKEERAAARQLPPGATMPKAKRKKVTSPPPPVLGSAQPAAAVHSPADLPNLKQLRSTRITLSSLKRKDLDDEALADTLFSATQRHARHSDIDEDDSEDRLASTVPDMARHTTSSATRSTKPQKGQRPTSHNGKRLTPLTTVGKSPWTSSAPNGRDLLARRAGAIPTRDVARPLPRKPTSPRPPLTPAATLPEEDAVVEEVVVETTCAASTSSAKFISPLSATAANDPLPPASEVFQTAMPEPADCVCEASEEPEADEEDPLIALREQISSLINRVGTMKRNSVGIRLSADLSYASYEKQKASQEGAYHAGQQP